MYVFVYISLNSHENKYILCIFSYSRKKEEKYLFYHDENEEKTIADKKEREWNTLKTKKKNCDKLDNNMIHYIVQSRKKFSLSC